MQLSSDSEMTAQRQECPHRQRLERSASEHRVIRPFLVSRWPTPADPCSAEQPARGRVSQLASQVTTAGCRFCRHMTAAGDDSGRVCKQMGTGHTACSGARQESRPREGLYSQTESPLRGKHGEWCIGQNV